MAGICLKRIRIMNKREISEIKKQFKKDNNAITRICGCYVDAEKQIKTTLKEAFFALSEEEIFKYYEIFKKSLSGGIGKNLHNLEYSIHEEGPDSGLPELCTPTVNQAGIFLMNYRYPRLTFPRISQRRSRLRSHRQR